MNIPTSEQINISGIYSPASLSAKNLTLNNHLSKHKSKCTICNHPDLNEINSLIKVMEFKTLIDDYQLKESTIIRHILAFKLYEEMGVVRKVLQLKNIIHMCVDDKVSDGMRISMLDQINKEVGVYKEKDNTHNIQELKGLLGVIPQKVYTTTPPLQLEQPTSVNTGSDNIIDVQDVDNTGVE